MLKDFDTFYKSWYTRATNFANEYVMDMDDAKNITQDVFLHILEHWDSFTDDFNLTSYLFMAVKNECFKALRQKMVREKVAGDLSRKYYLEMQLHYDALAEFNNIFHDEESIENRLREAIEKLPRRCRQIFVMRKIQGKRQADIAHELGISENTVETQMGIAYRKLRQELKGCLLLFLFLSVV